MDKTAIKNFAVWVRRKLISDITYKAGLYGITDKAIGKPLPQSTKDLQFFDIGTRIPAQVAGAEIRQREQLVSRIREHERTSDYKTAFQNAVEEVTYTWFNRLIAVRFMEVNDYLPSRIRVLSSETPNKDEPDVVTRPFEADLKFTSYERDRIMQLKDENKLDELFRFLFIRQCNALNENLPGLFQKTEDYSELLLTLSFADRDGVVYHLVHDIDEKNFNINAKDENGNTIGQVEIIGWMYQYYNTEPKDEVFALLQKNVKITKERVPAATQLFTPDWIVRYMVENSLGRLWVEHCQAESGLDSTHMNGSYFGWKYYLEEAKQEPEVEKQLSKIREKYRSLKPEDIKIIDPCMGSGHILVYAFDVLMQIYLSCGYTQSDAAALIVQKNLYGLDIDDRAYQLAYFAVMMKARQYDRRTLTRRLNPNLCAIQESNWIGGAYQHEMGDFLLSKEHQETLNYLLEAFKDAKEYGSILNIEARDYDALYDAWRNTASQTTENFNLTLWYAAVENAIPPLIKQALIMAQKYDVVVTNPPYMGSNNMGATLSAFVKLNYPHSKADLSTVCMEMCLAHCSIGGIYAMINIPVWMTQSSFEELRGDLLKKSTIVNMLHFGRGVFGSDFGTTAFTIRNINIKEYQATYRRLFDELTKVDALDVKKRWFFEGKGLYTAKQSIFETISGRPIAYWVTSGQIKAFRAPALNTYAEPRQGFATGDNDRFLRFWHEVKIDRIGFGNEGRDMALKSGNKWFPCNKGGAFRRWYGNNERVVNWENDGAEMCTFGGSVIRNSSYYFRKGMTWSTATMSKLSMRYSPKGFLFESKGSVCFPFDEIYLKYLLAFLNTKIVEKLLLVLAPTVDYHEGPVGRLPVIICEPKRDSVVSLSNECVKIAKLDWDAFETSWDFKTHPLIAFKGNYEEAEPTLYADDLNDGSKVVEYSKVSAPIAQAYDAWERFTYHQFEKLKSNEEELNRIFIGIYGLQDELTPEVADKDVTVRRADLGRDIRSFISYAVGCMFGRYSPHVEGLLFAGGECDYEKISNKIGESFFADPSTLTKPNEDGSMVVQSLYTIDQDNCIPITDEEYFKDDIVGRFVEFVRVVYGTETLEENLDFIASALGSKGGTSREAIRNYFLNDFYKNHCQIYQKRPIYWLFDSGKQNGFKALIYMHRYNQDTIGNLRVEYLHPLQRIYESEIARMKDIIDNSSVTHDVSSARKRFEKLTKQLKETREYDTKIAHLAVSRIPIDLDDGVKVNYDKVQTGQDGRNMDVLAKI